MSTFFYGYICTQIIGGFLSDKFGGKSTLLFGMFVISSSALFLPLLARRNITYVMAIRVIQGKKWSWILFRSEYLWIYYSEVFRSRRILIPSAFTAKIQSIKVEKQQTLTFPVRILLGYAEVINSARILDGISVRSPVRKAADTLQKVAFPTGFWKKADDSGILREFCPHSWRILWSSNFPLKFCSHSSKT